MVSERRLRLFYLGEGDTMLMLCDNFEEEDIRMATLFMGKKGTHSVPNQNYSLFTIHHSLSPHGENS
jgi:hypothetical protein